MTTEDRETIETLEVRLKAILPEAYQESYEDVQPVSMGSAGLKYGFDGKVAWDQIWGSFCDLAMAGGPPHKGTLLEPAPRAAIDAHPDQYREVVDEICRGVTLVTELDARPSPNPGWVRVTTLDETMAGWLLRAIVMENVAARAEGRAARPARVAGVPARKGNQERHHRHRQDVPLLDRPHALGPAAHDRGVVRDARRGIAADRTGVSG